MPQISQDPAGSALDVVIPARDAALTLAACLDSLAAAGVAPDAVTVVDDGSRDATATIARGRGVRVVAPEAGSGAAAARNLGAAGGTGDLILFVDADVCVAPDAVRRMLATFARPGAPDALFGSYDDAPPAPGTVSRVRNLLHHHVHQTNAGPVTTFWTGLGAVRRAAFEAVGGFAPEQRMMEDIRLGRDLDRAGYRIALCPEIKGAHLKRWTLASMLRTDLFGRAIPWSRMILAPGDAASASLNVSGAGKLSVVAAMAGAVGFVLALALALVSPGSAMVALAVAGSGAAGVAIFNHAFLRLVADRLGAWTVPAAVGILWLHFLMAGLGYAWVRGEMLLRPR